MDFKKYLTQIKKYFSESIMQKITINSFSKEIQTDLTDFLAYLEHPFIVAYDGSVFRIKVFPKGEEIHLVLRHNSYSVAHTNTLRAVFMEDDREYDFLKSELLKKEQSMFLAIEKELKEEITLHNKRSRKQKL